MTAVLIGFPLFHVAMAAHITWWLFTVDLEAHPHGIFALAGLAVNILFVFMNAVVIKEYLEEDK